MARTTRGITNDSACPYCHDHLEDLRHVLCDCDLASEVWSLLVPLEDKARFLSLGTKAWFDDNLTPKISLGSRFLGTRSLELWLGISEKARNDLIFNRKLAQPHNVSLSSISYARCVAKELMHPIPPLLNKVDVRSMFNGTPR